MWALIFQQHFVAGIFFFVLLGCLFSFVDNIHQDPGVNEVSDLFFALVTNYLTTAWNTLNPAGIAQIISNNVLDDARAKQFSISPLTGRPLVNPLTFSTNPQVCVCMYVRQFLYC